MDSTRAQSLQRLLVKARDETQAGATARDVLRYALAGYLIGALKYDDSQPRDDSGRWSDGGGGGRSSGGGDSGGDGGGEGGSSGGSGNGSHASMDTVLGDASTDMRIYSNLNDSPNKEAIGSAVSKHLRETSGANVSSQEGFEMARAVHQYAGNVDNYRQVRSGKDKKTSQQLDRLVESSAPYEGDIYRGLSFNDDTFANGLTSGAALDMQGISSWSSDKKHSSGFASTKKVGVLLSVKNKSAASITFLSKDEREQELLSPSKARYKVKSVKKTQKNGRTLYNVKLEEE